MVEKFGLAKGTWKFFLMIPLNYFYFVPITNKYTVGDYNGLRGKADFKPTAKGMPLKWVGFKDNAFGGKWDYLNIVLAIIAVAAAIFFPGTYALIAFAVSYLVLSVSVLKRL